MHVSVSGGTGSELREAVRLIQNSDFSLRITDRLRMWWFDKDGLPDWLVIEPEQMSVHFTDERPDNGDLVGELSDIVDHGIDGTISVLSYINDGDSTFEILADGQVRVKRPINTGETLDLERLKALSRAAEVRSQVEQ